MKKNSYSGFIIWMILYILATFSISFFTDNLAIIILWMMDISFIMITILMYIIYKTGNIHWFSGIDMDEANKHTEKQKEMYAKAHFDLFLKSTLIILLYSIVGILLSFPFWIHILVFVFGLIGVCLYSIRIKMGDQL